MHESFEDALFKRATHLIEDFERYTAWTHDENRRRSRRTTGRPAPLTALRPSAWDVSPGFNPYLARARRGAIAHAVQRRLRDRTYTPRQPIGIEIPKTSGGVRVVTAFEIADEVVSNRLLRSLTRKNLPKLSSRAYAYRPDLTPHDAISYVAAEFGRNQRLFIAEYDFRQFFDAVEHDYLMEAMERMKITISATERATLQAFLQSPLPLMIDGTGGGARSGRGIPQGTSVSLLMANIAASELDRALDRLGVGFARYADDTLIWSTDYGRICEAAVALHDASDQIGSPINSEKSPGIRLLVRDANTQSEVLATNKILFLGHELELRQIRIKESTVDKIKKRVQHLIFTNLLLEPLAGTQSLRRFGTDDLDYNVFVLQLRRYLYGPLSEADVQRLRSGNIPPMSFQGVMSFYPLVDDDKQLRALDEWILNRVWLAMRKRARLLRAAGLPVPTPHGLSRFKLSQFRTKSRSTGRPVDLRLPTLEAMAGVIRAAVTRHGLGVVTRHPNLYAYDERP
jgi:RNA-directed DNA polymerase